MQIAFVASQCIDGNVGTICATEEATGNWLSVQLPLGARVDYVAVYNRQDAFASLLGHFEIWLGHASGDVSDANATKCGEGAFDAAQEPAPYLVRCANATAGAHVTLRRPEFGYVSIAELVPLALPSSPALPPLPTSPSPIVPPSPVEPPPASPPPPPHGPSPSMLSMPPRSPPMLPSHGPPPAAPPSRPPSPPPSPASLMPPSPPPPSPPPAGPGGAYRPSIRFEAVAAGDVASFGEAQRTSFRMLIAELVEGISIGDVQIELASASVRLLVTILAPTLEVGQSAMATLATYDAEALGDVLGLQMQSLSAPTLEVVAVPAPSPPPPSPVAAPPSPPPATPSMANSSPVPSQPPSQPSPSQPPPSQPPSQPVSSPPPPPPPPTAPRPPLAPAFPPATPSSPSPPPSRPAPVPVPLPPAPPPPQPSPMPSPAPQPAAAPPPAAPLSGALANSSGEEAPLGLVIAAIACAAATVVGCALLLLCRRRAAQRRRGGEADLKAVTISSVSSLCPATPSACSLQQCSQRSAATAPGDDTSCTTEKSDAAPVTPARVAIDIPTTADKDEIRNSIELVNAPTAVGRISIRVRGAKTPAPRRRLSRENSEESEPLTPMREAAIWAMPPAPTSVQASE